MLASLALVQAATTDAPPTWSRTEVDALGPAAVAQRLLGDGAANVLPMWEARGSGPAVDAPLRLLMFRSIGRSSGLSGLCASDQIQVRFAPAGPIQGAATRVRTDRSWSSPIFYLSGEAAAVSPAAISAEARPAADAACRAIDPRRTHIFLAPDPDLLARRCPSWPRPRPRRGPGRRWRRSIAQGRPGKAMPPSISANAPP